MTLLLLGIVLWSAAHAFKRVAPGMRADLTDRFGAGPAKGFFAALIDGIIVGIVSMVIFIPVGIVLGVAGVASA